MAGRRAFRFALLGLLLLPTTVAGQGFRGTARTFVSYLQVRDLVQDSVNAATVQGEGIQRRLPDGTRVACVDEFCRYFRSGNTAGIAPLMLDLEVTAWTGVEGLSARVHVRAREPLGDRKLWPRSEKRFEALSAYLEYRRSVYRVRAGRLWQTTALGFYNYDGGSLHIRGPLQIDLDLYGGLSLVRGLNQYHTTSLISSVEPLPPQNDAYLVGVHARWRPRPWLATSFTYQREDTKGSSSMYSERIGGSARVRVEEATVEMELKYDLATGTTNLAKLRLAMPMGVGLRASGELRKYAPYFDLWTIWGAFSPVGYHEARARLDWTDSSGKASLRAYGGFREYGETEVDAPQAYEIEDHSWRFAAGGRYALRENTVIDGEYRYDAGFGSSRSGGDLSIQRFLGGGAYLALRATAFESFSEFTVGSGTVYGGGFQGGTSLGEAKIRAHAMVYRHIQNDRPNLMDLNQVRFNLTVEIPVGGDPGMTGRGTG